MTRRSTKRRTYKGVDTHRYGMTSSEIDLKEIQSLVDKEVYTFEVQPSIIIIHNYENSFSKRINEPFVLESKFTKPGTFSGIGMIITYKGNSKATVQNNVGITEQVQLVNRYEKRDDVIETLEYYLSHVHPGDKIPTAVYRTLFTFMIDVGSRNEAELLLKELKNG